jgi:outer membrane protein assembly factor BamB
MTGDGLTRRDLCRAIPVAAFGATVAGTSETATAQTPTPGAVRWEYGTDDNVTDGPVVLEDGTAVVADTSGTVYAVDAADGSEAWTYEVGSGVSVPPTVVEGTVVVSTTSQLVAIDPAEGSEEWTFDVGGDTVVPTAVDGTVLVGNDEGDLYAVTAETGEQEWYYERENPSQAYPTVAGDAVLLGGLGYRTVEAVGVGTGERRWGVDESVAIGAVDTDDGVAFGYGDRTVKGLDLGTGDRRWEYGTEPLVSTAVALGDGSVYVGDQSGTVHAVDAGDGTGEWTAATDEGNPLRRISVADDTVLTCDALGNLSALGTGGGDQQWTLGLEARIPLAWTTTEGAVFLGSAAPTDSQVYARELSDGSEGWTAETDGHFWGPPALTEDTVVAASYEGTVYGIERGSVGSSSGGQGLPGFGVGAALAGIGAGAAWYRRRKSSER